MTGQFLMLSCLEDFGIQAQKTFRKKSLAKAQRRSSKRFVFKAAKCASVYFC